VTIPATQTEPAAPRATPPLSGGRRSRRRIRKLTSRDILTLSILLGIPVLLDLALIWGPTIASVGLSFTNWDGISSIKPVGTRNYHTIFSIYPLFWPAVRHNLLWLAFLGVVATPLGLFFAVLLDKQIRFTRFYQSVLFLPVVLSLAIVGFIVQLGWSRDYGAVKAVDPSLKESAAIDGANEVQTFFRVTFPTLRPVNIIVLVITVIEGLRAFDIVYVVNRGRNGLELLSVLVFDNIVGEASRIGFGSALAVILFVICVGFIITYMSRILREEER
jgi:multiple sugar transport system permease protein